ncbi:hypothetical protein PVAND_013133 [Polypedilum vanderplanki]|uniref:Gamma-aminobutyric acid receptor subunit beta n=1 Tax=Polypedilum vanderplanki TaxID=319348 RepID=A0A9J6CPI5_POLVA|nr:hypothetical protein PVAND_013133 [Polypedilum vanderplanki]
MWILKVLIVIIFIVSCASAQQNVTKIIDSLTENYDKRLRPNYGKMPVNVGVSAYILGIHSFSEENMDFTMDFYFRQYWNDPRLQFKKQPGIEYITPGYEFGRTLWFPDTFFVNEKESFLHTITTKNEFVKIYHNGDVVKSVRLSVTFSCPMNFVRYPMDTQLCAIPIESYAHRSNEITYYWKDGNDSVGIVPDIDLPLIKVKNLDLKSQVISLAHGTYSRMELTVAFERTVGYYIIQIYIPCTMIVIIAWISFFLNKNAMNIRCVLCIAGLLSLIVECQAINTFIPKTSYSKALDLYTGICMTLVFIALVEFAFISNTESFKNSTKAPCADKIFRFLFPIFFIVFNIFYWIYY